MCFFVFVFLMSSPDLIALFLYCPLTQGEIVTTALLPNRNALEKLFPPNARSHNGLWQACYLFMYWLPIPVYQRPSLPVIFWLDLSDSVGIFVFKGCLSCHSCLFSLQNIGSSDKDQCARHFERNIRYALNDLSNSCHCRSIFVELTIYLHFAAYHCLESKFLAETLTTSNRYCSSIMVRGLWTGLICLNNLGSTVALIVYKFGTP